MAHSVVERILAETGREPGAAIAILQKLQEHFGYLPLDELEYVCQRSDISPTQLYGIATFYTQFRLAPVGEHIIRVCHGTACHVADAEGITEAICSELDIEEGDTSEDGLFTLETVACLGCCALAPVMTIDEKTYGRLTRRSVVKILREYSRQASSAASEPPQE